MLGDLHPDAALAGTLPVAILLRGTRPLPATCRNRIAVLLAPLTGYPVTSAARISQRALDRIRPFLHLGVADLQ
ncbi:hypothetical protein ASG37_15760 [Sphingomonas sp. Leaf407]|nr:hypothetical protein ASE97_15015 [Sphingomonas sp. Leaf42]KQT25328.1 hypothetical protein ASG37_15760 [Sphingomonas sp. Leaf407]